MVKHFDRKELYNLLSLPSSPPTGEDRIAYGLRLAQALEYFSSGCHFDTIVRVLSSFECI